MDAQLTAALLAIALSAAAPAAGAATPGPIEPAPALDSQPDAVCSAGNLRIAASGGFEYRHDKVLLVNVVISECGSPLRIEAQRAEASSLDFNASTWTFTGAVRLRMTQGELMADTATARFNQQQLTMATFNGAPATFEQQAAAVEGSTSVVSAHGHASTIVYTLTPGEVQLIGDAWLSNGCNELNGDTVVYNLLQKSVTSPAGTGAAGRVRGIIRPQCRPTSAAGNTP